MARIFNSVPAQKYKNIKTWSFIIANIKGAVNLNLKHLLATFVRAEANTKKSSVILECFLLG